MASGNGNGNGNGGGFRLSLPDVIKYGLLLIALGGYATKMQSDVAYLTREVEGLRSELRATTVKLDRYTELLVDRSERRARGGASSTADGQFGQ